MQEDKCKMCCINVDVSRVRLEDPEYKGKRADIEMNTVEPGWEVRRSGS
jgi:hypothetical protein